MTIAFAAITRPDLMIYLAGLQRAAQAPTVRDLRKLNKVISWAQQNPLQLKYEQFSVYPTELS
eukprot:700169-Amphidinium_carterae.1